MNVKHGNDEVWTLANVFFRDCRIGLYRAKHIAEKAVLLRHGAISFPVGTALAIQIGIRLNDISIEEPAVATVLRNSTEGMLVAMGSACS